MLAVIVADCLTFQVGIRQGAAMTISLPPVVERVSEWSEEC
jgi:hypothetical protein